MSRALLMGMPVCGRCALAALLVTAFVALDLRGANGEAKGLLERAARVTAASSATNAPTPSPQRIDPVLPATSTAPTSSLSDAGLDHVTKLGIGDRLSFRIIEDQEDAKPLVVMDSGELEVPYVGRVRAVGKTCRELAKEIRVELEKDYYYQATVIVALDQFNRSRGKIYIAGYVRIAGPQDVPTDEVLTLSKAIMRAGGFTDFADKRRVRLTRKAVDKEADDIVQQVDVGAIIEEGHIEKDIKLEAGDSVYVPSRLFKF